MSFLTIPFRFSGANFRPNDILSGAPSLNAISGMAHNVQRVISLDLGISTFKVVAFTIVFFTVDADTSTVKRPADSRKIENQSLNDIRRGHGEAALVVKFDVSDDSDFSKFAESIGNSSISQALESEIRFAGGEIFIGTYGEFGVTPLGVFAEDDWSKILKKLMRSYPTQGQIWEDQKSLLSGYAKQEGVSTLDAMLGLLELSNRQQAESYNSRSKPGIGVDGQDEVNEGPVSEIDEDEADNGFDVDDMLGDFTDTEAEPETTEPVKIGNEYLGILIPVANGYHEVGNHRNGQYFGEPILSLVRSRILASLLRAIKDNRENWENHFWKQQYIQEHRIHRSVSVYEK